MTVSDPHAPLPRGRNAASREHVAESQRLRLLAAMKLLAARDGYPNVTIAALVAEAGVAKPTFYERFADKEDCIVALIDGLWHEIVAEIVARMPDGSTPYERIGHALTALLEYLAADPDAARVLLVESQRAGSRAIAQLGEAHEAIATLYRTSREELRLLDPSLPPISETRALAAVGAVNEPLMAAVRAGRAAQITELYDELVAVVYSLALASQPED